MGEEVSVMDEGEQRRLLERIEAEMDDEMEKQKVKATTSSGLKDEEPGVMAGE